MYLVLCTLPKKAAAARKHTKCQAQAPSTKMYDVIIIGAGPAGLSTAFWCDELGLDTLVLEQTVQIGGQLHRVYNPIKNYLGLKADKGEALLERFAADVDAAEFDLWTGASIKSIDLKAKRLELQSGEKLQSIALVIATGVRPRELGVPGEKEFEGKGMIESATRDRELCAGKDVCVVGGGDAAVENALLLAEVCPTVTLVHRGKKLRARREFAEKLKSTHCVTIFSESVLTRIIGEDEVVAVEIQRKEGLKPFQLAVRGVLIRIGVEPNTELFGDQLETDEKRFITINSQQETSVPMVFAVGDVSNPIAPTISGATGAGATAAKVIAARLNARGVN